MTPERELLRGLRGDLLSVKDSPRAEVMIAKIDAILAQPETPSAPQKPSESPAPRTGAVYATELSSAQADLARALANHATDLSAQSDKKEQQIKPQPRPGAYLLESTAVNADYWLKNGRELPDRDEAVLAVEQAINAWKGVAYGLAEKLHFAGYDPTTGSCAVSAIAPLGWQPIETAPTDGTEILLTSWNKVDGYGETDFGRFGFIEKSDYDGRDVHGWLTNYDRVEEPTHWMQMEKPSAPVDSRGAK